MGARSRMRSRSPSASVRHALLDAAAVFAPQKGASPEQVGALADQARAELALRYGDDLEDRRDHDRGLGRSGRASGRDSPRSEPSFVPGFEP